MSVWSRRPQMLHLALFMAVYVLGSGFAQALAIVPGTGISIWPPGGLFVAVLILSSPKYWHWWIVAACAGELLANVIWFHNALPVAILIYVGNAVGAVVGAWLLRRTCGQSLRLETVREVLALVILAAGIAPAISATIGSLTLASFGVQSFTTAWPLWWIGDATGVLIIAPLALVLFQNWYDRAQSLDMPWIEISALALIFLCIAAFSLSGYLPYAYIIMPPLLWAAVRFELRGAVLALSLLALIVMVFTVSGISQFAGDPSSQRQKQIMLQLFLGISAFSALIVAAISRQHQIALRTLRTSFEVLQERERFLWQLVETLPAMIDCAAPNGEPIFRGRQLREFLGYELEDLDGSGKTRLNGTLDAGVHPDDLAAVKQHYAHSLATGEPYARRHRLRRHDGEYRWVETRAAPMRNVEGEIIQWNVIFLDIDGEVKAQENLHLMQEGLARASRAASLAELSASIAHEVNQPLSEVMNSANACLRWLQADPPNLARAKKSAERVTLGAGSAAEIIRRIRALFKQSVDIRDTTSLDGVIAETRDLVAAEAMRRGVRLEVEVESELHLLAFDRVQIQQVLMNLIRNALDAMASCPDDPILAIRVYRAGDWIHVEVGDQGNGVQMPDRIFEPFFTTKEQGMGMGLAISRSIVEAHGGQLWAEPNKPQGAKFIFALPAAAMAAA